MYPDRVPKTIQIRDLDDDVYAELARRAAMEGVSVPEWLRREIAKIVSRPSMHEWLNRPRRRPSNITSEEVVATLDELRGEWPDGSS